MSGHTQSDLRLQLVALIEMQAEALEPVCPHHAQGLRMAVGIVNAVMEDHDE